VNLPVAVFTVIFYHGDGSEDKTMNGIISPRERESRLLDKCVAAGKSAIEASNAEEACVFGLAAQLVEVWHPDTGASLEAASKRYFSRHGESRQSHVVDLIHAGVITDLPRFRNMLMQRLQGRKTW
jgi:hypothetical protein